MVIDGPRPGGSSVVSITHDFLATILGTNRPTVSSAAAILQKRESIIYMRGAVKIENRKRLEASACECYRVIHQFDRELGLNVRQLTDSVFPA
jgi:hypothetical protein